MYEDFYRSRLISRQAQLFYDTLIWQIAKGNTRGVYTFAVCNQSSAVYDGFSAIQAVCFDHPEYFFLSTENRFFLQRSQLILTNKAKYTTKQIYRIQRYLEYLLQQLCLDTANLPQWEQERIIYERIAKKLEYKNHQKSFDHDIVGPILQNSGVCEGINSLFILALRHIGIPCIRVNGKGDGQNHCWSLVWIDGAPCHTDITWDATLGKKEIGYFWFNLMDGEIQRDHVLKMNGLPMCNCPELGYHYHEASLFTNMNSAVRELTQRLWSGSCVLRVKLLGNANIERCLKLIIQNAPPGHYAYICKGAQHAGLILRSGT